MITLDQIILQNIVTRVIKDKVNFGDVAPQIKDIYVESNNQMNDLFNPLNIPRITWGSPSSATKFNNEIYKISLWMKSSYSALSAIILEHQALNDRYKFICERINNEMDIFKQLLNNALNYTCYCIYSLNAKQNDKSNVGRIGKFITLPYFLNAAKMYDGNVFIRGTSSGEVVFSNLESINAIPLSDWLSMKVVSGQNVVTINVTVSFPKTTMNAVHVVMLNEKISTKFSLYNGNDIVFQDTYESGEIFANFNPIDATSISMSVTCHNPNPSKPYAFQISSIEIFKELIFAKYGMFQSTPYLMGNASRMSSLSLAHQNHNDPNQTDVIQYMSIQLDETSENFSRVEQGYPVDVSSYKFKYGMNLDYLPRVQQQVDLYGHKFFKVPIHKSDTELWNMNVNDAVIFYGLNKAYAVNADSITVLDDPFENWTRVGNYYRTMIVNYEDNVTVNIGSKTCNLNGRPVTGTFHIPFGISTIDVHIKEIDFKFGNRIESSRYNGIIQSAAVYSDPLYPLNFAYMLAGMPEYDTPVLTAALTEREFPITGTSSVFLNESFIPLSMTVTDSKGRPYDLVMSKVPSIPGTFSIEPNKGRVRICPKNPDTFRLKYRRCSSMRKPAGALFNRLLTFVPLKSMTNMLKYTTKDKNLFETYFTMDGDENERALLIPFIQHADGREITRASLAYSLKTDHIYASVRLDLQSTNKYLTPIVDNVWVTGR